MKKLIAMLLALILTIPAAVLACEEAAGLPKIEIAGEPGEAWVAMEQSTACLFGMLGPTEKVDVWPAQGGEGAKVRGMTALGVTRIKGAMRYMVIEGQAVGLTRVCATVQIKAEYEAILAGIVARLMGEDAKISPETIVACTIYRTCGTISHKMVGVNADKVLIGSVLFAGAERAAGLYLSDWDGDGAADLVFAVNPGTPKKTTPAPEPEPTPKPKVIYVKEKKQEQKQEEKDCGGGMPKCLKVIQITIGGIGERFQQLILGDHSFTDFSKFWQRDIEY